MLARALQEVDLEEWSTDDESAFHGDFSTRLNRAYTKTKVHYAVYLYILQVVTGHDGQVLQTAH